MQLKVSNQVQSHRSIIHKSISQWSNRDFLIYFSQKYKEYTSHNFSIPKAAWIGLLSRIKGFKLKTNLSNIEYKKFIDTVFNEFFTQDNYIPSFGAIVSEKVFYITQHFSKDLCVSNEDFIKLRNELYSNEVFKKLKTNDSY